MPAFIGERNLAAKMALTTTTTKTTATTYSYALTFFFYFSLSSSSSSSFCLLTLALAMSGRPSIEERERERESCRRATKPKIDRINSKSIILLPGCYCDAPAPLSVGQFLACLLACILVWIADCQESLSQSLSVFLFCLFSFTSSLYVTGKKGEGKGEEFGVRLREREKYDFCSKRRSFLNEGILFTFNGEK